MATNTIIKFSRNSVIEESRTAAIRRLNEQFEHIIGQPVMVRYYSTSTSVNSDTKIDTLFAIGIKNGKGSDCYQLVSAFNKSVIYGVTSDLKDLDISAFPSGNEVYIYISPDPPVSSDFEANTAYYVYKEKDSTGTGYHRTFKLIDDGPKAYEDLSTGRTIYLSDSNSVTIGNGYSTTEVDNLLANKLNIDQPDNKNKVLKVNSDGKIDFVDPTESAFTAGKNIVIDNYEISSPNVICQYSDLPSYSDNLGAVVQYIGEDTDNLKSNRFYKATESGWNLISVQENWTNILKLTKAEYDAISEKDPDTLYFIVEGTEEEIDNTIFIYDICTSIMPTASEDYLKETFIYTGESTDDYKKGHLYQCVKVSADKYEWIDLTLGEAYSMSYQTFSSDNTNDVVKYIDKTNVSESYGILEKIRKSISTMKSFNGVIKYGNSIVPIVRLNAGIKDEEENNPDTFISFTIVAANENYEFVPMTYTISANESTNDIDLQFYLTIIS